MKANNRLPLVTAFFLLLISACSKDDNSNSNATPASNLTLLTSHGWRLNKFVENGVDITSAGFDPCELDNIFTYNADYSYVIDEGPSKCLPSNPQIIETGEWALANNQNILVFEPGTPSEYSYSIIKLTSTALDLQETFFDSTTMSNVVYQLYFVKS